MTNETTPTSRNDRRSERRGHRKRPQRPDGAARDPMRTPVPRRERETVIRWSDDKRLVLIGSSSPHTWRRLARQGIAVREERRDRDGFVVDREYQPIPLAEFRWG